jgi:hypothetical protein
MVTLLAVSYRRYNEQVTMKARLGSTGNAHSFFDLGASRGRWRKPRPGRFTVLYRMLVRPWPVWTYEKNVTLTRDSIRGPSNP